jgi:hypothetical protein
MRYLILLLIAVSFTALPAQNNAQKYTVHLSRPILTVRQCFEEIQKQTPLIFSYGDAVPLTQKLNFGKTNGPVSDFLDVFARETDFQYAFKRKKVLVYEDSKTDAPDLTQTNPISSDKKYTLSGYLRDSENGEELIYGRISVEGTAGGALSNEYGFYSVTLPAGSYQIKYNYLGFQAQVYAVELRENIGRDVELKSQAVEMEAVEIAEDPVLERIHNAEVGVLDINVQDFNSVPVVLGEKDILKTMTLLPGISGSNEGGGDLFVRGGSADQNLLLLDEAPVYNPSHLLGFFSVFNSDALRDLKVYKGGIPAQYGGRSSSVFDIRMKEGNRKRLAGAGGIGLISSRLAFEGPLFRKKGSFIVTGRRTYLDFLTRLSPSEAVRTTRLFFYDFNAKLNYSFGKRERNRIYLSYYFGRDRLASKAIPIGMDWGNSTFTLRWNHLVNEKVFSNTSLILSDYNYSFDVELEPNTFTLGAGISNASLKEDVTWFANERNTIRMGFNMTAHGFKAGDFRIKGPDIDQRFQVGSKQAFENTLYVGNDQQLGKQIRLNYGLRLSMFNLVGPARTYEFSPEGAPTDTTNYATGFVYKTYGGLEPRFSAAWSPDDRHSFKLSYSRLFQYIHKLSGNSASLPTDFWVPTSAIVRPQRTDQVSTGYFRSFDQGKIEASAELFYKQMANQIDYRDGATLFFNDQFESQLVFGEGRAYGVELLLRKNKGRFHGWVSYTLSRSRRRFSQINNGEWYSARQDRIHDASIVLGYDFSPRLEGNVNWVFATGDAVTFPSGKYEIDGNLVTYYTGRNEYRFPPYHRMDLGLTWIAGVHERFSHNMNFSIYNIYARENPFAYNFRDDPNNPGQLEAVRISLFSFVPSVTWNFEF